ncbi:5S rRNA maturation endonuclease (ribonuclease M5) [Methanohalophilus levihalophilus]|uniref:toprim domain-containing protein n=1 Tax=Methanohalophilus levihalophilus TaxID=1431282 RepID=UPI001AE162F5|nr:toprim domain-containing protein [Methanohalophilus levihalophilus]MBP2030948.1 5S rRNA maturation endonuclease (ribonuclease M5) [Methanohalophilus levihalophilus]
MRYFSDGKHHCTPTTSISSVRRRLEKLEELLEDLSSRSLEGSIIVVEGKRDVISLRKLGIQGQIETSTTIPVLELSDRLAGEGREVIILTDWDRRGDLLGSKVSSDLRYLGLDVDTDFRIRLSSMVKKEIKDVESLYSYMKKMRRCVNKDYSH